MHKSFHLALHPNCFQAGRSGMPEAILFPRFPQFLKLFHIRLQLAVLLLASGCLQSTFQRFEGESGVHRSVWKTAEPLGAATRPRKARCPSSVRCAYPAIGVRHEPSRAVKKARSQITAKRVSSWFKAASSLPVAPSPSRHAMPIAPYASTLHQSALRHCGSTRRRSRHLK